SACHEQARAVAVTFRNASSRLLEGGDAGLGNVDIVFGGATGSDRTNTTAINHDWKATGHGHKRTRPCGQRDGDRMMIISFVSALIVALQRQSQTRRTEDLGW